MRKNFTTIPNPTQPSDEKINAYEKGGIGTDHKITQETQRFSRSCLQNYTVASR